MNVFEEPVINVVAFSVEDVLTASEGGFIPDENEGGLA